MASGARVVLLKRFGERLSLKKVWLEGGPLVPRSPGPAVPWSSGFLVPCFPSPGVFQLPATTFLALWFVRPPGLCVRWSPGHPTPVPLIFWFSSPVVLWSPDALVLWSSTCFVSQFLGRPVLLSSCFLVLWS